MRKVGKNTKNETTWELNWEPLGTHFETAAFQNRADKRVAALLCESFFENVSRSVPKWVFKGNCQVQKVSRCVFETVKTGVISQDPPFDTKPLKSDFLMILNSILEAFWEPGLLTFCFLVAPVANACMFFGSQFPSLFLCVKSG